MNKWNVILKSPRLKSQKKKEFVHKTLKIEITATKSIAFR